MGRILRISSDRINDFAKTLDDMFGAYETLFDQKDIPTDHKAVGVGIFYFEEDKAESDIFN
jgi:hypothetical protein